MKVIGASAAFLFGQNIVCGGAIENYTECQIHAEGSNICDRNIDCVTTKGGAKWCTGPKTKYCYSYQLVSETWVHVIDLIKGMKISKLNFHSANAIFHTKNV